MTARVEEVEAEIESLMKVVSTNMLHQIDHRSRESFSYAREINKPWGTLEKVLDWSKQELRGDWRWQLIDMSSDQRPGRYIFYFDDERDCVAFALKWC